MIEGRLKRLIYKPDGCEETYLGLLFGFNDGTGHFEHILREDCDKLVNLGLDTEVLWDLLCGISEDVAESSIEKTFDLDKYTKYWINDFRFVEIGAINE